MITNDTTATMAASPAPLSVEARDDLVDDVLAALGAMAPAERVPMIEMILTALAETAPRYALLHRARQEFWNATLCIAHLEAGAEDVPALTKAQGRKASRAETTRHFERRAWSAATVLPLRTINDLLPASLHNLAPGLISTSPVSH